MSRRETAQRTDMLPAVWIGAVLSAGLALPLALPLQASAHDIGLLALLGAVQLAVPCLLVVRLSREAACPEIALLALLEVVFGVAWAWLGAGERPASETLIGGSIVLAALIGNELQSLRTTARSEARTSESWNSLWKLATSSTCRTFSAGRTRITVLRSVAAFSRESSNMPSAELSI